VRKKDAGGGKKSNMTKGPYSGGEGGVPRGSSGKRNTKKEEGNGKAARRNKTEGLCPEKRKGR